VFDNPTAMAQAVESGGEFDRLRDRRRHLSDQVRDRGEQIRALEQFADADHSHSTELTEQHARLASIGLIPAEGSDATCALVRRPLDQDPEARTSIERALGRAERRLELARRDTPRIDEARRTLVDQQRAARDQIRHVDQALNALRRPSTSKATYADVSRSTSTTPLTPATTNSSAFAATLPAPKRPSQPSRKPSTATPCAHEPPHCCAPSAAR
jgi:hypothetical protein